MLHPPEGGPKVPYTRASTLAKGLDDKGGLIDWTASLSMIGLMKSKSLQARIAAIAARSVDPYNEHKQALKQLVESATQLAQADGRAHFGTAIHEFTELLDVGELDWGYVPEALKGPLAAYQDATAAMKVVDTETFVAVDEQDGDIRGAGSLDRLYLHNDLGVCVGDLKTGAKEPLYPVGVMTQVAVYSRGHRYRDAEFGGAPVFDDGEPNADGTAFRKPLDPHLNKSTGILVHCPLEPVRGKYICDLYALNLEEGWQNLLLGIQVAKARKPPKLEKL